MYIVRLTNSKMGTKYQDVIYLHEALYLNDGNSSSSMFSSCLKVMNRIRENKSGLPIALFCIE